MKKFIFRNYEPSDMDFTKLIIELMFLVILSFFVYSSSEMLAWHADNQKIEKLASKAEEKVNISEIEDGENTEIINPDETVEIDPHNPYWDYIKMNLIDVDLNELKKDNWEIMGWIRVEGTNVNYPFAHTSNNEYYLYHSLDRSPNGAGWIFLDYRNNLSNDKHAIIYGHGRYNKTMFGSLNDILKNGWTYNPNNFIIKVSTETESSMWQIFSAYHLETTSDYLRTSFASNQDFLNFANMLKERSMFDFGTTVSENDVMLTLSTCYNDNEKMVIHSKLIKKEIKIS